MIRLSNSTFFMMRVRRQWLSDGKNCVISKVRVLVVKFLTQPIRMIYVSAIPTSVIDLNFNLLSWLEWIKLLAAMINCSLSPITFLINLPIVLSRTIGLKDLEESYNFLFGLGITTVIDLLKCEGQYPNLIQVLAIPIMLFKQSSFLRMILRWLHDNLSEPEVKAFVAVCYSDPKFFLQKRGPIGSWFIDNFIKYLNVYLAMESCVEGGVKGIP